MSLTLVQTTGFDKTGALPAPPPINNVSSNQAVQQIGPISTIEGVIRAQEGKSWRLVV